MAEVISAVQALTEGGVTEIAFYNWGHIRKANMSWLGQALRQAKEAT